MQEVSIISQHQQEISYVNSDTYAYSLVGAVVMGNVLGEKEGYANPSASAAKLKSGGGWICSKSFLFHLLRWKR
jgi:hypothetical protein